MSDKLRWILFVGIFIAQTTLCSVLAWRGSQLAIIMLAVTSAFLAIMLGIYGVMTKNSLTSWGRSLNRWQAAQEWGMKQDTILNDALRDLNEYDEEAAFIHKGRSTEASLEYLRAFRDEDAAYVSQAIKEELHG